MSNTSIARISEVLEYYDEHGLTKTCEKYDILPSTIERYDRKKRNSQKRKAKILCFDIETSKMIFWGWRCGKQFVGPDQIIDDWHVICWSAKWLYSTEVMSDYQTPEEAKNMDDKRVLQSIWKLLEQADIVISHNGKKFDHRKLTSRFILNGIKPNSPYAFIDTLEHSKKIGAFSSNRLNYLGQLFFRKEKLATDHTLWTRCKAGEQEALDYMSEYCNEDVRLLEGVYLELRPYMKSHPNLGLLVESEKQVCCNCGSENLELVPEAYYLTSVNKYPVLRCMEENCGAFSRGRKAEKTDKEKVLAPVAR